MIRALLCVAMAAALLGSAASNSPGAARPIGPAQQSVSNSPECRMGSDGQNVCGYNCMMGSDGHFACANTPDGVCAMGSDGRVSCSQLSATQQNAPPPECRMGSDGQNVCGYDCQMGSNGHIYCASRPDGRCAFNSDGTYSCP